MPSKGPGKKDVVVSGGSGGESGPGKQTGGVVPPNAGKSQVRVQVPTAALGLEVVGNDGTQSGGSKDALPPSAGKQQMHERASTVVLGHGTTPGQPRTLSSSSAGGTPMEVDLVNSPIRDKVSDWAKETEKACYAYGDELMQATQEAIEKIKGIDAQSSKAMTSSWSAARTKVQPRLNQCLLQIVESVPEDLDVVPMKESVHPGVRAVAFRDIVENARTDLVGSLEDLVKW